MIMLPPNTERRRLIQQGIREIQERKKTAQKEPGKSISCELRGPWPSYRCIMLTLRQNCSVEVFRLWDHISGPFLGGHLGFKALINRLNRSAVQVMVEALNIGQMMG
jgi:hypothetical protein